jgi:hypothetical protein
MPLSRSLHEGMLCPTVKAKDQIAAMKHPDSPNRYQV